MSADCSGRTAGLSALHIVLEDEHYRALPAEELLNRYLSNRDERAFVALVGRYGRLVMSRCREILRCEHLAQEAFQETFAQLIEHGQTVRRRGAVGRWLARSSRRRALNIARRERRQKLRDLSAPPRRESVDPSTTVATRDAGRAVAHALSALPERLRLPIELVYLDGMTHQQAAQALGWPKGTVDSYVRRGLTRMRPVLSRAGLPVVLVGGIGMRWPAEAVPPDWIHAALSNATGRVARPANLLPGWSLRFKGAALVVAAGMAIGVGAVVWPRPEATPNSPPSPQVPPASAETLPEQNLRLLRTIVAPEVRNEMQCLALAGGTYQIVDTDAYDSRTRCILEIRHEKSIPGLGEVSRMAFYYDSYLRHCFVYFDAQGNGKWKWIDVSRPLVLYRNDRTGWEAVVRLNRLERAVKAFEALPQDPRGKPEADRRWGALLERSKQYAGKWYRNGDPTAETRVEVDNTLNMRFYRPREQNPFYVVQRPWREELGSRAARPMNEDGYLSNLGIYLSADGQRLRFDGFEDEWRRQPR